MADNNNTNASSKDFYNETNKIMSERDKELLISEIHENMRRNLEPYGICVPPLEVLRQRLDSLDGGMSECDASKQDVEAKTTEANETNHLHGDPFDLKSLQQVLLEQEIRESFRRRIGVVVRPPDMPRLDPLKLFEQGIRDELRRTMSRHSHLAMPRLGSATLEQDMDMSEAERDV